MSVFKKAKFVSSSLMNLEQTSYENYWLWSLSYMSLWHLKNGGDSWHNIIQKHCLWFLQAL